MRMEDEKLFIKGAHTYGFRKMNDTLPPTMVTGNDCA